MNCLSYIPTEFTLFSITFKVRWLDLDSDNNYYGYFDSTREEIVLFETIKDANGEVISLTDEQKLATFYHEYFHTCQWVSGKEIDEVEAQTYSNLMMQFIKTSKFENPF